MNLNLIGPFVVNSPFGTEIAFAKGLRRMGHGVNTVDPNVQGHPDALDRDADATVVFKSCVGREDELLSGLRGPVVVYQPDDARFPHIRQMMLDMRRYSDLLLSFDDHGAAVAMTMGYRSAEKLLLTADDELYRPSPEPIERDIDVSFVGSMGDPVAHASRRRMCEIVSHEAQTRGWKFVCASGVYPGSAGKDGIGADTVEIYQRSKVVLNHATDVGQPFGHGYGLQCRHFEVGMTRTALVSNSVYGTDRPDITFAPFSSEETLIPAIEGALARYETLGRWMYDSVMDKHRPTHRAAQLVDFIERNR